MEPILSQPLFGTEDLLAEAPALYRFAMTRMSDHHHAEELVQDCLISALRKPEGFSGGSSLRTWLIGILRHKILDHYRKAARTPSMNTVSGYPEDSHDPLDKLFDAHGSWVIDPHAGMGVFQESPDESAHRQDVMDWIRRCMALLPERWRKLFGAKELDQLSVKDAAELAGVQPGSAAVLLTRARHQLRDCLQNHAIG